MMITPNSDAEALWSDVLDILADTDVSRSTIEMIRSCVPYELSDTDIRVSTSARFVQRTLENNRELIERGLEKAAFTPITLHVDLKQQDRDSSLSAPVSEISQEDFERRRNQLVEDTLPFPPISPTQPFTPEMRKMNNPLVEEITESDSRLTFDRFVQGDENAIALQAAKQVANGENKTYNPLFIYGKSGLGKTHLLKAIQNYIANNDPERLCVYRVSRDFTADYIAAMVNTEKSVKDAFERNYRDVDVLIIDDIQYLKTSEKTVEFFFDLFNYLRDHGKQIVLAADESPVELGLGDDGLDERITSRIDSGFSCPISAPEYELKYALIEAFYERMKEDAIKENIPNCDGRLTKDDLRLMAERSGSNIRVIEGFCQSCLLYASRIERAENRPIKREEIIRIANQKWPMGQRAVSVEQIQKVVENEYGISHSDLIGSKRNKECMEPRHVAIWLTRELTDNTLADIGNKFGGRSHATVKHSISWVDEARKADRMFHDQISRLSEILKNTE